VHYIEAREPLTPQRFQERHNFVRNETRMASCNFRAFDVLDLQANAKGIDARESVDSIVKTVIHHHDEWNLVFQDSAYLFKPRFTFIRVSPSIQVSSELPV
jgi:hypothetical protein